LVTEFDGTNYHITRLNHNNLVAANPDKVNPLRPINIVDFVMDERQHIIYMDTGNNIQFTIMDTVDINETPTPTTF